MGMVGGGGGRIIEAKSYSNLGVMYNSFYYQVGFLLCYVKKKKKIIYF